MHFKKFVLSLQVKIRGRSLQCVACGENAAFSKQQFQEFDYEKFTQSPLTPVYIFCLIIFALIGFHSI